MPNNNSLTEFRINNRVSQDDQATIKRLDNNQHSAFLEAADKAGRAAAGAGNPSIPAQAATARDIFLSSTPDNRDAEALLDRAITAVKTSIRELNSGPSKLAETSDCCHNGHAKPAAKIELNG